jgi:hypothetical protein
MCRPRAEQEPAAVFRRLGPIDVAEYRVDPVREVAVEDRQQRRFRLGRDRLIALHEVPGLGGHLRPAPQVAPDATVQQSEAQALLGSMDDPPSLVV